MSSKIITTAIIIITSIIIVTGIIVPFKTFYLQERVVSGVVTDKYVKGRDGKFFIVVDDKPFSNGDDLFRGKFNSADIYNKLKIGKKVKMKVYGARLPLFSTYENIKEII